MVRRENRRYPVSQGVAIPESQIDKPVVPKHGRHHMVRRGIRIQLCCSFHGSQTVQSPGFRPTSLGPGLVHDIRMRAVHQQCLSGYTSNAKSIFSLPFSPTSVPIRNVSDHSTTNMVLFHCMGNQKEQIQVGMGLGYGPCRFNLGFVVIVGMFAVDNQVDPSKTPHCALSCRRHV